MAQKYPGAAIPTQVTGGISAIDTSCVLAATTGWPDGSDGAFVIVIDPAQPTQEKILCSTRTGTTLNFSQRGYDGTTAASHDANAVIRPSIDAASLQRHENHIEDPVDAHDAASISYAGASGMSATTVEAAIDELAADSVAAAAAIDALEAVDHPSVAVFYTSHTWGVGYPTASSDIARHKIKKGANQTIKLISVTDYVIGGTSVTYDLKVNGSAITGGSGLSATTTDNETDFADVTLADTDRIEPDPTTVTGSVTMWAVTITLEHTVTLTG